MKSRISTPFTSKLFSGFAGITTARSEISMERPEAQSFIEMDNLYCSSKGYLANEPGFTSSGSEDGFISHLRYHDSTTGMLVYATRTGSGTSLRCLNGYSKAENIWPVESSVTSAYFSRNLLLAAGANTMRQFDGADFKEIRSTSIKGARYLCSVSNRVVVTGFDDRPYELQISRVNEADKYTSDESPSDASLLKAAMLDVQNVIGGSGRIRGIASFETNKLAIFTTDMAMVYTTDPDYTKWAIDPTSMISHGTVSHKSIVAIGGDLFFCSGSGVHSMRRSVTNGSTVFTSSISEDITELYQYLLSLVKVKDDISAAFDPVAGRLHIFFPVNRKLSYRLSASFADARTEQDITKVYWSFSSFANMTCADYQAGRTTTGTISGVKELLPWYVNNDLAGAGSATLPILWHDDIFTPKRGMHLVLYASGYGVVEVKAQDETGRELGVTRFELPKQDQIDYAGVPLQRQFIRLFNHEYVGIKLSVSVMAKASVRIFAIGVNIKKD